MAIDVGVEYELRDVDRRGIVFELLAVLALGLRDTDGPEPERRGLAVPVTGCCISEHRALDVLRVLGGVIFVEKRHHSDRQFRCGIISEGLDDRDDPHFVTLQLGFVLHEVQGVPEKARERMHKDDINRSADFVAFAHGHCNHGLKLGAAIVGGTCTCIDELADLFGSMFDDPGLAAIDLIGYRQFIVGLTLG